MEIAVEIPADLEKRLEASPATQMFRCLRTSSASPGVFRSISRITLSQGGRVRASRVECASNFRLTIDNERD
jgi:hypothetical protein